MGDLVALSLSGLVAAIVPLLLLRKGAIKAAYLVLFVLLAVSLLASIKFAEPGWDLWFFVPFWAGWLVALFATLLFAPRLSKKSEIQ